MLLRLSVAAVFTGALLGMASACSDNLITDPGQIVMPDSNVKYRDHIQPVFNLSCSFSGCHDAATRAGGLALTSYIDLFMRGGLIIPGNPDASLLVQMLQGKQFHPPTFQGRINQNHVNGIATWVREGAKNN